MKFIAWTISIDFDDGSWNYESGGYQYVDSDSWINAEETISWRLDNGHYVVAVAAVPKDGMMHRARWHDCTPYGMPQPDRYGKKYV